MVLGSDQQSQIHLIMIVHSAVVFSVTVLPLILLILIFYSC